MPQIIEVPNVGRVEFPDGMGDEAIVSAIKKLQPSPQSNSPAEGVGAWQAGLIAAGRGTDKIVQGVRQLYNKATGDQGALDRMAADEAEKDRFYAPLKDAHPVATAIGETAPSLAVPLAGPGGLVVRSAVAGALPGALEYGSLGQRAARASIGAAGGAVGGALGLGASRLLKPAGVGAQALPAEAIQAAENIGYKLSPGQRSQNAAMQGFENYLTKSPGSSGAMQMRAAANQTAMSRAAAGAMGQSADNLGEGVFAAAKNAIGSEFNRLQDITAPQLGDEFLSSLAKIDSANAARGSFRSKSIDSLIDKGIDLAAQGKLTGTAYKEIRTQISNDAQSAFKAGDATLGQALKTVRGALDDAAKKSLSEADQAAWDTTRQQWQAYKLLTKSNVAEGGNLSAPRLAAAIRQHGDGLRTGATQGPLADIARIGESLKGVQNPNSGQLTQQMLYGNPLTGLPMMAGNKVSQMAYTNPLIEKYLSEGLLDVGVNGQRNLGRLGQLGAGGLLSNLLGVQ